MSNSVRSAIRLRGVRHNNLKNFDLDLPLNRLIVITGLSGSGKSSLAFDTLFAEGQRRYIETFSPYARQFFDRMDKPRVDSIEGIPPAIAIEQRNAVKTTRSTVGTMTEICDHMKLLWPRIAQLHCRKCQKPVHKEPPQTIWATMRGQSHTGSTEFLITFELALTEKLSFAESLALVAKQGYQRLLVDNNILRLDEVLAKSKFYGSRLSSLTIIQDRLNLNEANRARFVEACEQAYHFGKGKLAVLELVNKDENCTPTRVQLFSNRLHCAGCDIEYREASPALFSFNHPVGACPACKGFGRIISIDYNQALPDRSKTLAGGAVKPWQSGQSADCQTDLLRACRHFGIATDVPFEKLPRKWQDFVIDGEPEYGKDEEHEWPRAWYGIKGYFRWLESRSYKMHVRVLLSRYRAYTTCPECHGKRFQPDALLYRIQTRTGDADAATSMTLADFYALPIRESLGFIVSLAEEHQRHHSKANDPHALVLSEVRARLGYLDEVGLGYLTLDRPTRSLSGGETERVNLTTCLGTRLVNTLFVLDEPSVGLHPRDTDRLIKILHNLRAAGNTVVVVEHEASIMRSAEQIIDLGPGHGAAGGHVVFQGRFEEILRSEASLTGQYLSGRRQIETPARRAVQLSNGRGDEPASSPAVTTRAGTSDYLSLGTRLRTPGALELNEAFAPLRSATAALKLEHATLHNLDDLSVEIPLNRFVCITGVSGSGKTTLMRDILLPALAIKVTSARPYAKTPDLMGEEQNGEDGADAELSASPRHGPMLTGWESLGRVILVDQSSLGKTPRSNPAVYIGAFDHVREFFAQSEVAKRRGLNASAFSFNSAQGQCERCRGAGFEKIEMQFLSDVFIRCPDCDGRRYRSHILEVKVAAPTPGEGRPAGTKSSTASRVFSIADLLEATVEETIEFLAAFPDSRPARNALQSLTLLEEVGLGYLSLGQPINTLSGGESQRLKLVRHLADAQQPVRQVGPAAEGRRSDHHVHLTVPPKPSLFLFDEPTTGLHFEDVRVLLKVFQRLVDGGHSVVVIEHNLDIIKCADWLIDLGPDAGDRGGQIMAQGPPEAIAACTESHTGTALRQILKMGRVPLAPRARAQK